jgi:hypothetical protein
MSRKIWFAATVVPLIALVLGSLGIPLAGNAAMADELPSEEANTPDATLSRDCVDCPEMIGVQSEDGSCPKFEISRYEVTWQKYQACVDAGMCKVQGEVFLAEPDEPAFGIDFDSAVQYSRYLAGLTGEAYRLPSVRHWYEALGETKGEPFSERAIDAANASNLRDRGLNGRLKGEAGTAVGVLVHGFGNVAEWTSTCQTPQCQTIAVTGGHWNTNISSLLSEPYTFEPRERDTNYFGFRVMKTVSPETCPAHRDGDAGGTAR